MNAEMLAWIALALGAIPALVFLSNLPRFRPPPTPPDEWQAPKTSILIPARDEEATIEASITSAAANLRPSDEIVVLDDGSTDRTAELVGSFAADDRRIRLIHGKPLPEGWVGKMHACSQLAAEAEGALLLFVDADVRLAPDCARHMAWQMEQRGAGLLSGLPRQITGSLAEKLLIPIIHFILLGFLSIKRMRKSPSPAFGAACGQVLLANASAYKTAGGHAAIRDSIHDGLDLPRTFRRAGQHSDLCDITGLSTCRMYHDARSTIGGLAKNAGRGMGSPKLIWLFTALLFGGQVLPFILLATPSVSSLPPAALAACIAACVLAIGQRFVQAARYKLSILGALLHPLGILGILAIQWMALGRKLLGLKPSWRGRPIPA